ncbi:hypothetical protein [Streptosporangium sp. NBC_01756]|uniref:hypothetical protein n=1 Tax=Streptosporangium sp. NBC_01756 TaxID=2975950 RepID=UPI002DD801E8|nr:hypothetical protein [Streptosporangium sp. NBC_01756]WSC90064.1 hypothetical protein OIE48_18350 [Streptosporangium sp. NBC_01756]
MSPESRNGAGVTTPERRSHDQKAVQDTSTIHAQADRRSIPTQLPIVLSATAYPAGYGLVTILIVLDQECPCGDWHNHRVKAPAPALLSRKARCGMRYELALHAPRSTRRGRRAA